MDEWKTEEGDKEGRWQKKVGNCEQIELNDRSKVEKCS